MDIVEIMSILPHRYPFLLIDRVIEMERKTRIVAIKNVTANEPQFTGPLSRLPHHARRHDHRSHGPGRRRAPAHRNPRPRRQAHGLHRHRRGALPPPHRSRGPAPHRGHRPQLALARRQDAGRLHGRWQGRCRSHRSPASSSRAPAKRNTPSQPHQAAQ